MKFIAMGAVAAMASVLVWAAAPGEPAVTVHEWGTFTSVSGADGKPISWRPLNGPVDLPKFVYGNDRERKPRFDKWDSMSTVRMETPVLYFYADQKTDARVKVGFPNGGITEWYPNAAVGDGIDWGRIQILPGPDPAYLRETADSHYYPARETDAAPIRVKNGDQMQDEKFLFYRGVGWFQLPVQVSLKNDRVVVKNLGKDPIPQAIVFESQKGSAGFRVLGAVRDEVSSARPELSHATAELFVELERTLVAQGLYEKEARAMIKTWRDSWFEDGLRVFYIVPRAAVDAVLPLTMDPKPKDVVRVFVGRAELITPEMDRVALEIVARVGDDAAALRKEMAPYGRFALPLLYRTLGKEPAKKGVITLLNQ
jgi:hypothetical protein